MKTKKQEIEARARKEAQGALMYVKATKKNWELGYTLKARIYMRIFAFIFPGILKIKIYDTKEFEKMIKGLKPKKK